MLGWLGVSFSPGSAGEFGHGGAGGICDTSLINIFYCIASGGGGGGSIGMFHGALQLRCACSLQSLNAALLKIYGFAGNSTSMTFLGGFTSMTTDNGGFGSGGASGV